MRPIHQSLALAAAILAVTGFAYLGSLDGEFVSDDRQMVEPNPLLKSLDVDNVWRIFTSFDDANYMPLKVLSLAVDQAVWGPEPFGYHLTNLILHIGCALLIFSILRRLGLSRGAAFFISLLWAVHPLQVESVAWISERKNVLSGFFFFAAFRAYVEFSQRQRIWAYVATLLLYSVALLSKMNTLVLPAICLAFEATYRMRYRWRDLAASVPMFAMGALTAWYNLSGSESHGGAYPGGSVVVTWLSSAVVVFRYLSRTLLPVGLNSRYNVALYGSPLDTPVFAALVGIIALVVLTVWLIRRKKREAFWLLWFAITLAPMLNIIPFRSMMQDRYMYLALLGPVAFLGSLLDSLSQRALRRTAAGAATVAIVVCVAMTARQIEYWSDPISLWVRDATTRPLRANERIFFPDQYPLKHAQLEAAVREAPDDPMLRNNLGALYFAAGRTEQGLDHLEKAHRLDPDEPFTLINLGRAYGKLGRFDEGEVALTRATELRPYSFMACYYLVRLHLMNGDATKARPALEKCSKLHDNFKREWSELSLLESK